MKASYIPVGYLMQIWGFYGEKQLIYNPSSKMCKLWTLKVTFYRIILSVEFSFKLGHLVCEELFLSLEFDNCTLQSVRKHVQILVCGE